jgi:hypothetical protein
VGSGGLGRSLVRKPLPEQVGGGFCVSNHTPIALQHLALLKAGNADQQ